MEPPSNRRAQGDTIVRHLQYDECVHKENTAHPEQRWLYRVRVDISARLHTNDSCARVRLQRGASPKDKLNVCVLWGTHVLMRQMQSYALWDFTALVESNTLVPLAPFALKALPPHSYVQPVTNAPDPTRYNHVNVACGVRVEHMRVSHARVGFTAPHPMCAQSV